MPDLKNQKIKHLTLEERTEIQDCLFHGLSFKAMRVLPRLCKPQ